MYVKLDLNQINLKKFLEDSKENGMDLMTQNVFSVNNPVEIDVDEPKNETAQELYNELIDQGNYVYVNFSSNAMAGDVELECIDGNAYLYLSEEEAEEYFEEGGEPEDFLPYKNLEIYEDSSVGYLLKYMDGKIQIQSAIIRITDAVIEPVNDVEIFNQPMDNYLEKYKM